MIQRRMRPAIVAITALALAPAAGRAQMRGRGYATLPPPAPAEASRRYGAAYHPPTARPGGCEPTSGGTILGAIAGGLLGGGMAGRGDRDSAALIGSGPGALAGHPAGGAC